MSMNATLNTVPGNVKKITQLEKAVDEILREALHRGFYGTTAVELTINDGLIQHIRRRVDRIEK